MAVVSGFELIRESGGRYDVLAYPSGMVDVKPDVRFGIEKKNAFDPSIIVRKNRYRVDTFDCQVVLTPTGYNSLISFMNVANASYYIEYHKYGDQSAQYPVIITKYPSRPDNLCEYNQSVSFTLQASYVTIPVYVNYRDIMGDDENEMM